MKYLIVGLGNIGAEYESTRHNSGFITIDNFAKSRENCTFSLERLAYRASTRYKGREIILIKPTTFMNLSGKAVRYWLDKEKIPIENLLIIVDDIALPLGTIRLRLTGSDGGHNGLKSIIECLSSEKFSRLRFGVGNEFKRGGQIDYVLGKFSKQDMQTIEEKSSIINDIILAFSTIGMDKTMNMYNGK